MTKKGIGSDGEEGDETGEPQWQKCGKVEQKYRKYGLKKIKKYYLKEEENACKNGNLIEPGDENKIETMKKDVGLDGEEGGETGGPQQQKYGKSEAIAICENSNSSNTAITLQLLKEQVRKMKTLETRIRVATIEALNRKRMESGQQPGNMLRRNYKKYGLKIWHRI